jgi:hypothetical protein
LGSSNLWGHVPRFFAVEFEWDKESMQWPAAQKYLLPEPAVMPVAAAIVMPAIGQPQEPAVLCSAPQQLMPGVWDPRGVCARLSEQLEAAGQAAAPGGAALQCVAQLTGAGVAMVNSGAARNARWSWSPSMALEPSVPRCVPLGNACWSSARALQPGDF